MAKFPKPVGDNYLILPDQESEEKTSGAITPAESKDKPKTGTVVSVGRGIQASDTGTWIIQQADERDKVLFSRFSASPVMINDVQYLIISQRDLLLIL